MRVLNGRTPTCPSPTPPVLHQQLCSASRLAARRRRSGASAARLSEASSAGPPLDLSLAGPVLPPVHPEEAPGLTVSQPFVVGVAGGTASGKTTVCQRIAAGLSPDLLGRDCCVLVEQDSFYRNLTPAEAADVSAYNWDHPAAYEWGEMVACVRALKQGQPVHIPVYDYKANARRPEARAVGRADIVLFDGILAFHNTELTSLMDLKIFVDVDADVRLSRRMRRDIAQRGRGVEQVLAQYERTVKPSHDAFVFPSRREADVIIPRGADNTVAIDLVIQLLRSKLAPRLAPAAAAPA